MIKNMINFSKKLLSIILYSILAVAATAAIIAGSIFALTTPYIMLPILLAFLIAGSIGLAISNRYKLISNKVQTQQSAPSVVLVDNNTSQMSSSPLIIQTTLNIAKEQKSNVLINDNKSAAHLTQSEANMKMKLENSGYNTIFIPRPNKTEGTHTVDTKENATIFAFKV
jgi:hypothetical protein